MTTHAEPPLRRRRLGRRLRALRESAGLTLACGTWATPTRRPKRTELSRVTLHVLPQRSCPPNALEGGFTLLGFPEPDEPDLLYHEYPTGALHIGAAY